MEDKENNNQSSGDNSSNENKEKPISYGTTTTQYNETNSESSGCLTVITSKDE